LADRLADWSAVRRARWSRIDRQQLIVAVALTLTVLVGALLRFHRLGASGVGNAYYAATVKTMLTSWHNFFFGAFEPGGSVSVDKPPLGFWIQAASARAFGVNGFALALPQALAGTLAIPLLYSMVKRPFGRWAGLVAAFVLAITPVAVSAERNNTIDGLLVFVLLLATWAFLKAVRSGRLRDLLLGAVLIGVGFNIKMLQAFVPVPALYALYLLGARKPWRTRILHLALATGVMLAVALSWAIVVDLTPAENRPYVGSSENNTVMELISGHNGVRRLIAMAPSSSSGSPSPAAAPDSTGRLLPPGAGPAGQGTPGQPPWVRVGMAGSGNPRSTEVGEPGVFRLITEPLVGEAGWLLPLALLGIPLVLAMLKWQSPLSNRHLALVLWAGWLLPSLAYFSFTSGLFHAYYLIMLGAPLAALLGATAWALRELCLQRRWLGLALVAVTTGATLALQVITVQAHPAYVGWVTAGSLVLWLSGLTLLAAHRQPSGRTVALALVIVALTMAPLLWSTLTALNPNPDVALPRSGPNSEPTPRTGASGMQSTDQEAILEHLLANTEPDSYLVATLTATDAAAYILATGRPVLTFGGFRGSDDVVDEEKLEEMVADGELRFVLGRGLEREKPKIAAWLEENCSTAAIHGLNSPGLGSRGAPGSSTLYDCACDSSVAGLGPVEG
jgi:4-amino-4-deoxy-L-arabinose transferase-like glycosyltransferase